MKRLLTTILLAINLLFPAVALTVPAYAAPSCGNDAQGQVLSGFSNCSDPSNGQNDIGRLIANIISILSWVVGIAAVIVIILSALKYITSGGDSNKTGEAKKTLIYALVGLVVAVLAQFIISFTVNSADSGLCPTNSAVPANSSQCTH